MKRFLPYLMNPSSGMDESLQDMMRSAINDAQKAVTQAAPGSGTTLTAALVLGQQMTIGMSAIVALMPFTPMGEARP